MPCVPIRIDEDSAVLEATSWLRAGGARGQGMVMTVSTNGQWHDVTTGLDAGSFFT